MVVTECSTGLPQDSNCGKEADIRNDENLSTASLICFTLYPVNIRNIEMTNRPGSRSSEVLSSAVEGKNDD